MGIGKQKAGWHTVLVEMYCTIVIGIIGLWHNQLDYMAISIMVHYSSLFW